MKCGCYINWMISLIPSKIGAGDDKQHMKQKYRREVTSDCKIYVGLLSIWRQDK